MMTYNECPSINLLVSISSLDKRRKNNWNWKLSLYIYFYLTNLQTMYIHREVKHILAFRKAYIRLQIVECEQKV